MDLKCVLDTIENADMRAFCEELIKTIPEYWHHVGASSTGKYHPAYSLGEGGLARHSIAVVRFLNHALNLDCMKNLYDSRERDMLRIAALMHDSRKSGDDSDYAKSKYTKFDHPILASDVILSYRDSGLIPKNEVETIANAITSHMGQWNTDKRSSCVLPTPSNKMQIAVHLADYFASRKDITLAFDEEKKESVDPKEIVISFGKYKGEKLGDIPLSYLTWLRENYNFGSNTEFKKAVDLLTKES